MSEWICELEEGQHGKEEIVRCRDCRYEMNNECTRIDEWVDELWFPIEPDGFCKWGERKIKRKNGLEPCPFCGSEFTQVRYMGLKNYPSAFDNGYRGECCDCNAVTNAFITEADAINAWNTRVERTCHDETKPRDFFTCSECHTPIGKWVPVYCPNCGARVVSE